MFLLQDECLDVPNMEENDHHKMKKVWMSIVGRGYGLKRVVLGASPWSSKRSQRTLWFKLGFNRWKRWTVPEQVSVLLFQKKQFLLIGTKEALGEAAHQLRSLRFPDVYHRKGIHSSGQMIRRKAGKKAWTG